MAGFFGFFDYSKPGPGVSKDEPQKHGFFVFFEVFQRKFFNLIKLNMLFSIFNIPAFIILPIITQFYFQNTFKGYEGFELGIRFAIGSILIFIPVITVGPAQAGLTYVLRNYSREEHSFLFSDFIDNFKSNFKQASIVGLIDLLVTILVGVNLNFYNKMSATNALFTIPLTLMTIAFVFFIMMHIYIYPLMVTFKLSIKQIYKNSLIFAMAKLFPNLLLLIVSIVVALGPYVLLLVNGIQPLVYMFLTPIITISFIGLITNFYANRVLQKFMIDKEMIKVDKNNNDSIFKEQKKSE